MSLIGVIVVDYQSDPLTERLLSSLSHALSAFPSLSMKVIVVENCPTRPRQTGPKNLDIQFLRQDRNLGFGRAVNLAGRYLETPYLLLLNPDVELFADTLSILYNYIEKNPKAGIVVPKLIDHHGNLQHSARRFYDFPTVLFRRTFLGRFFPNHPVLRKHLIADWDHASVQEIDWALGACMLIRRAAVGEEIFDPRFFLYFEDVDLCVRMKKNGWKVVYHPDALAVHAHRQKSRKHFLSRANFEHFVSWVKFMVKHRSISGNFTFD